MRRPSPLVLWLLVCVLPNPEDEPIVGDLIEDHHLRQASGRGPVAADTRLLLDILSFIPARLLERRWPVPALAMASAFTLLAGLWLAYMEQVLGHSGHATRSVIDLALVLGSVLILAWMVRRDRGWLRAGAALYAVAAIVLGAWEVIESLRAGHFEGFVLVIATALCLQGLLALSGMMRFRTPRAG
jgi:hypothetical protein